MEAESNSRTFFKFVFFILLIGGGYFAYTHYHKPAAPAAAPQMPPAEVTIFEAHRADIPLSYEYAGRTAGSREVEIRARVSGILQKRAYTEGQSVKEGDTLFEIDPAPFAASVNQIKARATQAERDWERAQGLFKAKALSAREYDEARANFEQTKAELTTAQINLGYTTVTAPISGVTSKEGLSEGSLVNADTSLLTRLTQLDPIYVNFSSPDSETLTLRRMVAEGKLAMPEDGKLKAEIHFGDGSVYGQEGTVDFTDSFIDAQTGSVNARAVVPNAENMIMPGQFVRVVVKGFVRKNMIAVPDEAIMQGPQGPFVYVVTAESKTAVRPVVLGALNGESRLIESGIEEGDKVIIEGMIKTRPDAPVHAMTAEEQKAAAEAAAAKQKAPEAKPDQK